MKHLVLLFVLVLLGYFGCFYLPEYTKVLARNFRSTHLFKVLALIVLVWGAFMTQATFGSGKIF